MAAETVRTEVNDRKAAWISDRIRLIRGTDRRAKLYTQIRHEEDISTEAVALKQQTKTLLSHYQAVKGRMEAAFKTKEVEEVGEKFKEVMRKNDLLQKNIDHMLVCEAKLRVEYERLREEWSETVAKNSIGKTNLPKDYLQSSTSQPIPTLSQSDPCIELAISAYHWLNNLSGLLRQISRVDSFSILGPSIPFVLLYTGQTTEGSGIDFGKQAAKMCLLLEKKLITAIEITTQRAKTKVKRKKLTFMQIFQNSAQSIPEERTRTKLISEQHFTRNPSPRIQSLIGSYSSAIQKEIIQKQPSDPRNVKKPPGKPEDKPGSWEEQQKGMQAVGQLTSRGGRIGLPEVNGGIERAKSNGWATDRTKDSAKTDRRFEAELKDYVASRTREMRKSGSTEGLVDFLREIQTRKRDLDHFIDKHKKHLRTSSLPYENPLEASHKKTTSSITSTCPSVEKARPTRRN